MWSRPASPLEVTVNDCSYNERVLWLQFTDHQRIAYHKKVVTSCGFCCWLWWGWRNCNKTSIAKASSSRWNFHLQLLLVGTTDSLFINCLLPWLPSCFPANEYTIFLPKANFQGTSIINQNSIQSQRMYRKREKREKRREQLALMMMKSNNKDDAFFDIQFFRSPHHLHDDNRWSHRQMFWVSEPEGKRKESGSQRKMKEEMREVNKRKLRPKIRWKIICLVQICCLLLNTSFMTALDFFLFDYNEKEEKTESV